jgi:hypothetical protein
MDRARRMHENQKSVYTILVGNPEGKKSFGRPGVD